MAKKRDGDSDKGMAIRDTLTPQQRDEDMYMPIDPGFVHIRAIETILGEAGMKLVDKDIKALPADLPEWMKLVRIDQALELAKR